MMFQICTAFAVSLMALAISMGLIVFMKIHKDHTSQFCRAIAYIVVILALLTVICVGFCSVKFWNYAHTRHPQVLRFNVPAMMLNKPAIKVMPNNKVRTQHFIIKLPINNQAGQNQRPTIHPVMMKQHHPAPPKKLN